MWYLESRIISSVFTVVIDTFYFTFYPFFIEKNLYSEKKNCIFNLFWKNPGFNWQLIL